MFSPLHESSHPAEIRHWLVVTTLTAQSPGSAVQVPGEALL
jgi:hypothetical protein